MNAFISMLFIFRALFCINETAPNNGMPSNTGKDSVGSGVYLTVNDYRNNHLYLGINCKTEKHKIRLNDFFDKPYITVIHSGKKYTLQKDSIFGYRTCEGKDYRFYKRVDYEIQENGGIVIYVTYRNVSQGKGFKTEALWFFSRDLNSDIRELTIDNVKNAYPDNHNLHHMIDMQFKKDKDLTGYDKTKRTYNINLLITKTEGQK